MATGRQNSGTKHLRWVLTDKPYAPNLRAQQDRQGTVSINVSTNGVGIEIELTPANAREFASCVFDLANAAEQEASR